MLLEILVVVLWHNILYYCHKCIDLVVETFKLILMAFVLHQEKEVQNIFLLCDLEVCEMLILVPTAFGHHYLTDSSLRQHICIK